MRENHDDRKPGGSTRWEIWARDTFDRDASARPEADGVDIVAGFAVLWAKTVGEGVLDDGNASYTAFSLTWGATAGERVDIRVQPFRNGGLGKIRHWFDGALCTILAATHARLLDRSARWSGGGVD